MRVKTAFSVLAMVVFSAVAFGFSLYGGATLNSTDTTDLVCAAGTVNFPNFSYVFDFQMRRDGMADPFYGYMTFDHYWYINSAYFSFPLKDLRAKVGRMNFVEGPGEYYHLFLSDSAGPFNGLSVDYKPNDFFSVKEDLISLNDISPRSLYYREFTVKPTKKLSLSYEESILFMRSFDPWYAFIALPYPAIEVFRQMNSDWQQDFNDNALVGFSANYDFSQSSRMYTEILIDDIDMNAIFAPDKFQNPNKIAWLFGGQTKIGNFGITVEYAGATAYTFEKTDSNLPDGYAYVAYPSDPDVDGNMIGYRYGENNDALKLGVDCPTSLATISVTYEHVRLGKRTPLDPWHGASSVPEGTHWLDGPVIETRNTVNLSATFDWGKFTVEPSIGFENIENEDLVQGQNVNNLSFSMNLGYKF